MNICDENMCTGCGACKNLCPVHCINIKENGEGFLFPEIDEEKCIHCNKCYDSCPSNVFNVKNFDFDRVETYFFTNEDKTILRESSSGGAFSILAGNVIKSKGVVFGAIYDKSYNVVHEYATNYDELNLMRGSKYVESNTTDTYEKAKKFLKEGKIVLFTGTPCQIAGLYSVLEGKKYDNLYTIDILCHGVPSAKLFREYISTLEKKYGKIINYSFRDKEKWGWGNWGSFIYLNKNNKQIKKSFVVANDYFYSLFFKECIFRESCYKCKYAQVPRIGDLTIGDCWGIEEMNSNADLENGVSLILINSKKGKKLISDSISKESLKLLNLSEVIKYNQTIIKPTNRPNTRNDFYKDFEKYGFEETASKYCKLRYFFPIILRYVPRNLKNKIKKLLRR